MELKVYSIRDAKGEIFHPPFYKKTHGEAERDFTTLVGDQNGMVSKYPEDFDLWYLGTFDDQTGKFNALETPQHVIKAIQIANRLPQVPHATPSLHAAPTQQ